MSPVTAECEAWNKGMCAQFGGKPKSSIASSCDTFCIHTASEMNAGYEQAVDTATKCSTDADCASFKDPDDKRATQTPWCCDFARKIMTDNCDGVSESDLNKWIDGLKEGKGADSCVTAGPCRSTGIKTGAMALTTLFCAFLASVLVLR